MEKLFKMIFTTDNLRLVVLLVAMACGFVWLRSDMRVEIASVREEIASVREDVRELKTNDIAHLYSAIEALTFTLMKNGTLTPADKEYIDGRLRPERR